MEVVCLCVFVIYIFVENWSTFIVSPQWKFSCDVQVKWETRLAWMVFRLGCGLGNAGFNSWYGPEIISSPKCPYQLQGPHKFMFTGYWELFSCGMKQLGHEADH